MQLPRVFPDVGPPGAAHVTLEMDRRPICVLGDGAGRVPNNTKTAWDDDHGFFEILVVEETSMVLCKTPLDNSRNVNDGIDQRTLKSAVNQ